MLKSDQRNTIFFSIGALLLLLIVVFMAPATPGAGEKTPPFYSEEDRKGSASASDLDISAPVKDFPTPFTRPKASSNDAKPPPYPTEGPREAGRSASKPDGEDLTERTPSLDGGSFQTQEYVVKEGDWLVKILRERGLMNEHNLPELLSLLRKLNSSLRSLDMIQPGEKIVILVKVVPESGSEEKTPPRKLTYETYRVKRGDTLSQVAMRRYHLTKKQYNRDYLGLFAACNPSIKDPDHLSAGQIINLPHYPQADVETAKGLPVLRDLEKSPHRVALKAPTLPETIPPPAPSPSPPSKTSPTPAKPVKARPKPGVKEPSPPSQPWPASAKPMTSEPVSNDVSSGRTRESTIIITDGLGAVISRMGEEWVHSGEHVIPMMSGGHIHLDAESYPMVRFREGITLIVDLNNTLPQKMARVLESTWANYRVVRLSPSDGLRSALDKILNALNYPKAVKKGAPLTLGGAIPVSISGDWIVTPPQTASGKQPGFVVINLVDGQSHGLPLTIKTYLKGIGVEVIEYPSTEAGPKDSDAFSAAQAAKDSKGLIQAVLDFRGLPFTTQVNIPAYKTFKDDFRFTVQADFYLDIGGRRYIIDVGGLSPDVVALLKENGISVLCLGHEKEPVEMVSKILEFLDVHFERGPHSFTANTGNPSSHVRLTLSGITFYDHRGISVLATSLNLPPELVAFLSQRGYRILVLSPFSPSASGNA